MNLDTVLESFNEFPIAKLFSDRETNNNRYNSTVIVSEASPVGVATIEMSPVDDGVIQTISLFFGLKSGEWKEIHPAGKIISIDDVVDMEAIVQLLLVNGDKWEKKYIIYAISPSSKHALGVDLWAESTRLAALSNSLINEALRIENEQRHEEAK